MQILFIQRNFYRQLIYTLVCNHYFFEMRSFKEQWGLKAFSNSSHRSHLEKESMSFLGCFVLKIKLRREIEENRLESIGEIRDNFIFLTFSS